MNESVLGTDGNRKHIVLGLHVIVYRYVIINGNAAKEIIGYRDRCYRSVVRLSVCLFVRLYMCLSQLVDPAQAAGPSSIALDRSQPRCPTGMKDLGFSFRFCRDPLTGTLRT